MTALYMDGFDHYGTGPVGGANMLDGGVWAQISGTPGVPSWGLRTGLASFEGVTNSTTPNRMVIPGGAIGRIFLSFGYSVANLPSGGLANRIVSFCNSSNTIFATLWCQSDGSLIFTDGSGATLGTSSGAIIVPHNWHFFEMDFNPTAGDYTLRVDDASASNTPIMIITGTTYASTTVAQLQFVWTSAGAASDAWIDDLFLRDASGTINNSWLGDRRVATMLANGDTTTAGWSPRYYKNIGTGILNTQIIHNSTPGSVGINSSTHLNVGAADFTIEDFVRFAALPTGTDKAVLWGRWDAANNGRSYQLFLGSQSLNSSSLCFQTSTDGTNSTVNQPIIFPWSPETDTWYHVAVVRAAGELLLFINGDQQGLPIADTSTYFAATALNAIAGELQGTGAFVSQVTGTYLNGWSDEFRLTNGVGRYTSNFTPTTVPFPRSSSDPDWSDVTLLMGFDGIIQDESSFSLTAQAINGVSAQTVNDGPLVGVYSTLGKSVPDDFTFSEAPFLPAVSVLTLSAQPAANDTVTVGTKDGTTAAVYKFVTTGLSTAFNVLIDTDLQNTLQNLYNAINAGTGSGTKYGTGTTSNFDVIASQLPAGEMMVSALNPGTAGNSIATTVSLTHGGSWTGSTLAGGVNIPGPSNFKIQRLPNDTTLVSAVQVTTRSFKSDAGVGSINTALIGPLGGASTGSTHSLTVSPVYYNDIYEEDPDTSGPISPTTIINGSVQINRVT